MWKKLNYKDSDSLKSITDITQTFLGYRNDWRTDSNSTGQRIIRIFKGHLRTISVDHNNSTYELLSAKALPTHWMLFPTSPDADIDLDDEMSELVDIIFKDFEYKHLIRAFMTGSRVFNCATEDSDYDIVVTVTEEPQLHGLYYQLWSFLSNHPLKNLITSEKSSEYSVMLDVGKELRKINIIWFQPAGFEQWKEATLKMCQFMKKRDVTHRNRLALTEIRENKKFRVSAFEALMIGESVEDYYKSFFFGEESQ